MKEQNKFKINLQLFGDEQEGTLVPETPTPAPITQTSDEMSFYDAKIKLLEKEKQLEALKVAEMAKELNDVKSVLTELKALKESLKDAAPTTPITGVTDAQVEDLRIRQTLVSEIERLNLKSKLADEKAFITQTLIDKPFLKDVIKLQDIKNQNEYIKFILPMESFYETAYKNEKAVQNNQSRDIINDYGFATSISKNTQDVNKINEANQMGIDFIKSLQK